MPDTETLYTVGTQNILNEYSPGTIYTWDVKVNLMGLQKEAVSRKIVEIYDLPLTWQEYADLAQVQIELLMKNCHLMPGMLWTPDKTLLIPIFSFLFSSFSLFNSNHFHPFSQSIRRHSYAYFRSHFKH